MPKKGFKKQLPGDPNDAEGVDGLTVRKLILQQGIDAMVEQVRTELRARSFRPSPVSELGA